jgi:transposase
MDARRLTPELQEHLRCAVVFAVRELGMSDSQAARTFGVCRQSVGTWVARAQADGVRALAPRRRGPKRLSHLRAELEQIIVRMIRSRYPEEAMVPRFPLWTRPAVAALIDLHTFRSPSMRTVGRYLTRWGLMPKRLRGGGDPGAWRLDPAIRRRASEENALILWGDVMRLRNPGSDADEPAGSMLISATSDRGKLWFTVSAGRLSQRAFTQFLERLLRATDRRKLFLILEPRPEYKRPGVNAWLAREGRAARLELLFLPGGDLNSDDV